uniref:Ephrin-B2b n=1 Tax=Astyanax mexicanus TaxID=7994 RepID=A0A3B1IWP4_ASTMX
MLAMSLIPHHYYSVSMLAMSLIPHHYYSFSTLTMGLVLYPQIGDKMDIVCPRLRPGSSERTNIEYFRVYLVTKEQLETCRVEKDNMALLNCDKPDQDVKFTFKFQEFSPNLWGLEFLKGKDYHIICKYPLYFLSLATVLETPVYSCYATGIPPKPPNSTATSEITDPVPESGADGKSGESTGPSSSEMVLFAGVASGVVVLVLLLVVGLVVLIRQRRHRKHAAQCSGPLPLHTLPKRGSGGANNNGSEPSDIIFPLRSSDSMYCPHYEKVSGDYGHPVYIVQEMPPQSPANIYYKV